MKSARLGLVALAVIVALMAAWPVLGAPSLEEARLVVAPDGVLFVIHEGVRYRVTPQQRTAAELGAIPEGSPLPVGLLAPPTPVAAEPGAAPIGGPPAPQVVRPDAALGLSKDAPIPLGWTCSCTIDRAGPISQFDITVVRVLEDAFPFLQQANRFNRPPAPGARYVGVYVDVKYIDGPRDQAYTLLPSDFRATALDDLLRDPSSLISPGPELEADIYPGATVDGWVFFELPRNQPVTMVWQFSFIGERGVWFALR